MTSSATSRLRLDFHHIKIRSRSTPNVSIQLCCKEVIWRSTVHRCPLFPNTCVHDTLCGWTHLSPADQSVKKEKVFLAVNMQWKYFPTFYTRKPAGHLILPEHSYSRNKTRPGDKLDRPNNTETPYRAGMSRWCNVTVDVIMLWNWS